MIVDDSALIHEAPYDPQKAREYYLRTRKLKGSKAGAGDPQPAKRSGSAKPTSGKPRDGFKKSPAQKRKEADAEVAALKQRLARLKEILADLVKGAKSRSGIETKTDKAKSQAQKNHDTKARTPLTAKQKREAAARSKKHYQETKKNNSSDKNVQEVRAQIKEIKAKLKAAIEAAKKQSAHKPKSQTAPKGR